MHIAVIGSGYVGLVTGACFAEFGVDVTCVDIDADKIAKLAAGEIPIYEPGLEKLILRNIQAGRLRFTTDIKSAVDDGLVIFLAVGTPPNDDGSADLSYIEAAARSIAEHMASYKVIVTKSTVPIGTGERLRSLIREHQKTPSGFGVVSNPEFLREGAAINDFMRPDRVVIGSRDEEAIAIMRDLYRPLYLIEAPFVITSLEGAELIKYAANAFLATKISFINEIANLCDKVGCDVHDVARAIGMDRRIGPKFLHPGPGFGGSCFPKDTLALASIARDAGAQATVSRAARSPRTGTGRAGRHPESSPPAPRSSNEPARSPRRPARSDDVRDAPAIGIIQELVARGARVRAYDPAAMTAAAKVLPDIEYAADEYAAAAGADVLVLVTEWNQFRALDMKRIRDSMKAPRIADLRNIYEPGAMRELGFEYVGVGR